MRRFVAAAILSALSLSVHASLLYYGFNSNGAAVSYDPSAGQRTIGLTTNVDLNTNFGYQVIDGVYYGVSRGFGGAPRRAVSYNPLTGQTSYGQSSSSAPTGAVLSYSTASTVNGTNAFDLAFRYTVGMTTVPVPVPAAIWLFGTAIACSGWMRLKQSN